MKPSAEQASELDAICKSIQNLTVHGVGINDDGFIVYCRAKFNAQKRIPKTHSGFRVKYVLGAAVPAGAR